MPKKPAFKTYPTKQKNENRKLTFEERFDGVATIPLIVEDHQRIRKRFDELTKIIIRFKIAKLQCCPNNIDIIRNYIQSYHEYYEYDQFDNTFHTLPSLDVNPHSINDQFVIYKSYNIFRGSAWQVRFGNKFASRVKDYNINQIEYILSFIMMISKGNFHGRSSKEVGGSFGYVTPIEAKTIPHNRFFSFKIFREKNIIFNVGVEKIPIVRSSVIKRYEYRNYLQFLDIVTDQISENPKKLLQTISRFQKILEEDVAKRDHSDELNIEQEKGKTKVPHLFEEFQNPYTGITQIFATQFHKQTTTYYKPFSFKPTYVSLSETSSLIFDKSMKRWVSNDYLTRMEKKALNEYQRKVNEDIIKRFVDFQSAKTLVELLTKIPNFRVNLTEEEKNVIGENGNVLVIGRSGTGKTTCAVLRLFAIEMLFKIRLSLSKKKYQSQLRDTRCSADDIDQTMGLHCIFLTASPVLTNQIQRYYKKLTDNIKAELEKKKKRVEEEKKMMKKKQKQDIQEIQTIKIEQTKKEEKMEEKVEEKGEKKSQRKRVEEEEEEMLEETHIPDKLQAKKSKQVMEEEEEMNQQFEGIKIEEEVANQTFKQDEEDDDGDIDNMKQELEEKMRKFKSLEDMGQEDFPGFFTVKSFIMMIDATLKKPFFIRKNKDVLEEDTKATWHNEKKGVMMIQNYYKNEEQEKKNENEVDEIQEEINYSDEEQLQHEYLRQIQLRENREKQKLTEKLTKGKKTNLSFEVDYDYFETYFWPTVRHRHFSARNITPHLVWTEIFSTIKGGASAHLYPGLYMAEQAYIRETTNVFLSKEEKLDVFETFCQYERWKINSGGYDLMDAVNYILNYLRFRTYEGPQLHYIMIDEVQDLPHSIIYLLSKTVSYGVFYSGDTAQTIAKGIGFRFCDLKNLFDPRLFDYSLTLKKPIVKQLTVNFRSHNNILQLANSVVSSIEILFPKTIDRLKKEVSNLGGPKPIILADEDQELLFYVLCGDQSYKKKVQTENQAMKKPPLEFGCDQVIIVRDQESKNKIPSMLQHALCLTIYEAKGLQFNDVILFNFFTETKCGDKWNLLKFLKVAIEEVEKAEYQKTITKHEDHPSTEVNEEEISSDCIIDKKNEKYLIKRIISDAKLVMKDINDYADLCSELKMLYTAITRPRKTLIIYDQESGARKNLQKLWDRLDVVEVISKEILNETGKKKAETQEIKIFKSIVNSTNSAEWKKQGIKMYSRGYFEQAMKCFQKSGNEELYKKALGNSLADNATKKLIQIESERNAIKNRLFQYSKMSDSDMSKIKKRLKRQEVQTFEKFMTAAATFEDLMMFKQAGQCYFSGKKFQRAFENFTKAFMYKQAAESLEMMNKYRQAAEYYEKDGNYIKIIECLDLINEWEQILKVIHRYSDDMTSLEKQSLLKKYSALALQELIYEIEFENEITDEKPENNRVQIIKEQEESEEDDEWDSDEDPELAAERSLRKKSSADMSEEFMSRKLSATESEPRRKDSQMEEIKESVYEKIEENADKQEKMQEKVQQKEETMEKKISDDSSFADLNESKEQSIVKEVKEVKEAELKSVQNSFADLNSEESSFAQLNSLSEEVNIKYPAELQPDMESIKSMADPEDPWIKSALSEIQAKTHTEYSIIDEEENYNPNVRIIKTKGNIFIQDQIMRKIINIVSIVNVSVHEFFKQFKGYQSLITVAKEEDKDIIDNRPEISDFEDVDPQFINIILDTLESFKLYKLCLFVCNRYHMPHKAGRYLISMAIKYSTNAQVNNLLNPALLSPSIHRKMQLEKGILASIALHAIFENVSSDFLRVKVNEKSQEENKNSLGSYFIEGLILEGLYKKAIFIVNTEESLKILNNFFDFSIYKEIFRQKVLKLNESQNFNFLDYKPKTSLENQFTFLALEDALFKFNIINRNQLISQRVHRQLNLADIKMNFHPELIPEYSPLLRALITSSKNEDRSQFLTYFEKHINYAYKILLKGSLFEVYDVVSTLITIITTQNLYKNAFELSHEAFLEFFRCIELIRTCMVKQHIKNSLSIVKSVLSVYQCRLVSPCKSTKFINDGYVLMKRGGVIANEFVEELKKNRDETAYFFEQDYNLIIVKLIKILQFINKKFMLAYNRFIRKRSQIRNDYPSYLPQDFDAFETEEIIKAVLRGYEYQLNPTKKKQKYRAKETTGKKKEKPKFDYKMQGKQELAVELYSEEEYSSQDEVNKGVQMKKFNGFVFNDLHPKLHYLYDPILHLFDQQAYRTKYPINGKILYCAGLNDSYQEHVTKFKGYNLYDAIEFKRFKRLDLYADNILSVSGDLPIYDRHMILSELLILLLVELKSRNEGKNFKIQIPRDFLKHFNGLRLVEILGKETDVQTALQLNSESCIFTYKNYYSSEMKDGQIIQMICELLEVIRQEENSKYTNFPALVLVYVLNVPPNPAIYDVLRTTIQTSNTWTNPLFYTLRLVKGYEEFCSAREKIILNDELLKKNIILHEVKIENHSDSSNCVSESERDYEIKQKILEGRKRAVTKISKWWKIMRKKIVEKKDNEKQIIKENRIIKCQHKLNSLPIDDDFLVQSSNLRTSLLNFYLKNVVTSSLDFHFILMTLNKIEDLRQTYIKAFDEERFIELEKEAIDVHEEILDLKRTIEIWKNDAKWLKDRNIDLKRKKVFEVKWMTKSTIQTRLAKKRAGLKKQRNLQLKKQLLKRR